MALCHRFSRPVMQIGRDEPGLELQGRIPSLEGRESPPFPRRVRSPELSNGNGPAAPGSNGIRPLQIARPPSRPTTPSNSGLISSSPRGTPPNTAPSGPSRPQRSELRSRGSEYSTSTSRDSTATDFSSYRSRPGPSSNPGTPANSRSKPARLRSAPTDDEQTTPTALTSVMTAFQSAGTRRRGMTNGSDEMDYQRERREEIEVENQRQQRIRDKAPGRRVNGKARAGDIDAVLDQVKDGWEFVVDPEFNNVDLALELLDESSVGKDMDSFRRTKNMLSKALKGSVDKHYQAFAAALPHHASLLNHLGATQTQIADARTALQESKDALGSKRADLVQLWARGQTLEEMMRLLDQIEHLKSVPDLLETLMSEKRLLQASVLLVRSLKIINKSEMMEIGAVADLRSYLNAQETALREILIDELQSHLYLKSFWCESRWAAYSPNQQTFPKVEFEEETELKPSVLPNSSPSEESFRQTRLSRFINDLALRPNDPPHDLNDPSFRNSGSEILMGQSNFTSAATANNPESDSFAYMETLLESFAVLGKLGNALDNIGQRLPSEIFTLVETTLDEVEERAEYGRRGSMFSFTGVSGRSDSVYTFSATDSSSASALSKTVFSSVSGLRLVALESSSKQVDHEILRDFFWTLYSKLDAIAQSLRVIYEVANRIGSRRDFKDASGAKPGALFPLAEIWAPVQSEVRTLIYDYLVDENQGSVSGRNPISSINEILRESKFSRDKTKAVFRFADTDAKLTNKALRSHEDELTRVLKDTMPGLVQSSESTVQAALSTVGTDDRLLGAGGQHHRLIIRPDAFHVSVLFQPTLAFLDRVSDVLPSGVESARESTAVLDDFVLKVYLPQLEEKVSYLFHQAVTGPEAFQADPSSSRLSPEPLVKASTHLMALINSLCAMLLKSPFHRENYSRLILGVMIQFYQRCSDRFQVLVSIPASKEGEEPQPALAAQWAQRSELTPCLAELLATPETDSTKLQQLSRQETNLEMDFLGQNAIQNSELVASIRNLGALASLHRSVAWFALELQVLKATPEDILLSPTVIEPMSAVSPYTPFLPAMPSSPTEKLQLPLSREMALRFQALLKTYEQLSELILDSIRIDIRCRTIHYLESALRYGNYSIEREAGEPDPHIVDLNNELGECNDFASTYLPKRERQFVFMGLSNLMEQLLIAGARHLRQPTAFGIKKIMRNILALQQSIKTLTNDQQNTEFERAKRYYSLFNMSPQDMLDGIRKKQSFTFDEYQTMLNLQCKTEGGGDSSRDRNYSMYVIDLHGLEMESGS
ncbi:Sec8 exocyst complex component-specific domain-containing protein [Mycena rosella]|uniref:Exocyst complex component Sec8 n=1 Tax=Mycena rosella TaxID=1033263 RepID=A0AAD7M9A7_MYCRO|nr:Sec8 exocyst complex component-specific domain-containing protein [Mycena rosella]